MELTEAIKYIYEYGASPFTTLSRLSYIVPFAPEQRIRKNRDVILTRAVDTKEEYGVMMQTHVEFEDLSWRISKSHAIEKLGKKEYATRIFTKEYLG